MEIDSAKKILANAEMLIAEGIKAKTFDNIQSGQALLKQRQAKHTSSFHKLEETMRK